MRGDKSFAYDLLARPGRVSGRVALLLRSTERKPVAGKICESFSLLLPISGVTMSVRRWRGFRILGGWVFTLVVICTQGNLTDAPGLALPSPRAVVVVPNNAAFICLQTDNFSSSPEEESLSWGLQNAGGALGLAGWPAATLPLPRTSKAFFFASEKFGVLFKKPHACLVHPLPRRRLWRRGTVC
jgi:hypothetical protein